MSWSKKTIWLVHISALRKLLGPQTIATIPGRGYRFMAEVDARTDRDAFATADPLQTPRRRPTPTDLATHHETLYGRDDDMRAVGELLRTHRASIDCRRQRHRQDTARAGRCERAAKDAFQTASGGSNWRH